MSTIHNHPAMAPPVPKKIEEHRQLHDPTAAPSKFIVKPIHHEPIKPPPRPATQARRTASGDAASEKHDASEAPPNAAITSDQGSSHSGQNDDGASEEEGAAVPPEEVVRVAAAALAQALDCADMSELPPAGSDSGIFEVIFPDGERMGVAITTTLRQVSYLLNPVSDQLRSRLRQQQMELEKQLKRRIHKNVKITVL